jgi:hypothetical protein
MLRNEFNATNIRLEIVLNDVKKVTVERSIEAGQNVKYLVRNNESLGRINRIEIENTLPDLIQKVQVDYLSHSMQK